MKTMNIYCHALSKHFILVFRYPHSPRIRSVVSPSFLASPMSYAHFGTHMVWSYRAQSMFQFQFIYSFHVVAPGLYRGTQGTEHA